LLQKCGKDIARLDCVEAEKDFVQILRRSLAGTVAQVTMTSCSQTVPES
jgi:hypothetical protein